MKAALLLDDEAIVLQAVKVEPGSENDQPPIDIQVCKPEYLLLSAVKRLSSDCMVASIAVMVKVPGSKYAKAIFACVKPTKFSSSGATPPHGRSVDQDS
jgi:hypothetical protein